LRKAEAPQLLAEILNHVVALSFAVHQHVQPELLLLFDALADLVCMAAVYAASLMVPFLKSRRILRISAVCGNEPMLVVGKGGKASQLCAFLRVG